MADGFNMTLSDTRWHYVPLDNMSDSGRTDIAFSLMSSFMLMIMLLDLELHTCFVLNYNSKIICRSMTCIKNRNDYGYLTGHGLPEL